MNLSRIEEEEEEGGLGTLAPTPYRFHHGGNLFDQQFFFFFFFEKKKKKEIKQTSLKIKCVCDLRAS
jgi:hypothetical protein